MFIDGFTDLRDIKDRWVFFAFSANYKENVATIYLKIFNENPNNAFQKNLALDFDRFALKNTSEIIFGAVENNDYFDSVSGFVGQIGFI